MFESVSAPASRARLVLLAVAFLGLAVFSQQIYFSPRVKAASSSIVISEVDAEMPRVGTNTDTMADWTRDTESTKGNIVSPTPTSLVVISQLYGSGGNSGATYKNDFIEIFNRSNTTVSLAGWSVQYASAAGTSWSPTALSGTLAPGQYYLVQLAAGAGGTTELPAPDAIGSTNMSGTLGKVALVSSTTALTGGCPLGNSQLIDLVGYGSASCFGRRGASSKPG